MFSLASRFAFTSRHDRDSSIALCCGLRARCARRALHWLRSHPRRNRRVGRRDCRKAARDSCFVARAYGAARRRLAGKAVKVCDNGGGKIEGIKAIADGGFGTTIVAAHADSCCVQSARAVNDSFRDRRLSS